MAVIRTEILIQAPIVRCFDAARDMGLHVQSAAAPGEKIVAGRSSGLLELGESVTFEGRHFGIRFRMTSKIVELEPPRIFVDEMQSGPFKRLRHEHLFFEQVDGTQMVDVMDFVSPFGPLGAILDSVFVARHLKKFLISRGQELKTKLEAGY